MKKLIFGALILLGAVHANAQSWNLTGNAGTSPATNFVGTTDGANLKFKSSGAQAGLLTASNTSFGVSSLINNTGNSNVGIGVNALSTNTSGGQNTALGTNALYTNSSGGNNVAIGYNSMYLATGNNNTAIGYESLFRTTGGDNVANGVYSLNQNTTGSGNAAVGVGALYNNSTGGGNTAIGYHACYGDNTNKVTGTGNTGSGYLALVALSSGVNNTANGNLALASNSTGFYNTAIGASALQSNTTAHYNVAVGWNTMFANTTGQYNTAVGTNSLLNNSNAFYNTAIGWESLKTNTTGQYNTAIGSFSLWSNLTGQYNTANGLKALYTNYSGGGNTAGGHLALYSNYDGNNNTATGNSALYSNSSGANNTAFGFEAGKEVTTGANNTFLGYHTGYGITTGGGNTIIGANVTGLTTTLANTIILADGTGAKRLFINSSGYAGFGTVTPNKTLEVNSGTAGASGLRFTNLLSTSTTTSSNGVVLSVNSTGDVILVPDISGGSGGTIYMAAGTNTTVSGSGTSGDPFKVHTTVPSTWTTSGTNIINTNTGGVIIGTGITSTPTGYKLYVSDGILAEKIKVAMKTHSSWADHVFSDGYNLRSLADVENFIKINKHLPGIPSAENLVKEGGIDVNDMFARQMEKIEELTLYMIEVKKEIDALKKENTALQSSINNIKQ